MPPCFLVQSPIFNSGVDHIIFATSGISGWNIPQEKETQLLTILSFYDRLIKHDLQVSNTPSVLYPSAAQPSHFLTHTCFFFVCVSIRHTELVVLTQEMIKFFGNTVEPDGQMDLVQMDLTVTTQTHTDDRPLFVHSRSFGRPAASLCFNYLQESGFVKCVIFTMTTN